MFKRIFLVVMDSVGIGEAKDSFEYNDVGSNTVKHIIEKTNVFLPNLNKLGLSNLIEHKNESTYGYYARATEESAGKDTLTGHLEMMGLVTTKPFKTFLNTGFPKELIHKLEAKTGRKVIGNIAASGTEIIEKLGEEHMKTGSIIVYTSADSVLQIAAHEEVIPLEELYKICKIAREITLNEEWKVGRVIARPFIGSPGSFIRTPNRHDYALNPSSNTVLDELKESGFEVIGIGKISDVFNGCGITCTIKTNDNLDGINKLIDTINSNFYGLCFANLNDFDSKYGHRRDVLGYGNALKILDDNIPRIISNLKDDDLIIFTADHGNDPTYMGTDHTRENTPVLIYSKKFIENGNLGILSTFSDIGATIADNFNVEYYHGQSFLSKLK